MCRLGAKHGLPTAPLASRLINQRAAAPWITLPRKAPLIDNKILSKQTGPALFVLGADFLDGNYGASQVCRTARETLIYSPAAYMHMG